MVAHAADLNYARVSVQLKVMQLDAFCRDRSKACSPTYDKLTRIDGVLG